MPDPDKVKMALTVDVICNHRRRDHMLAYAHALVRKARRRDRPALITRMIRDMVAKCYRYEMRLGPTQKGGMTDERGQLQQAKL